MGRPPWVSLHPRPVVRPAASARHEAVVALLLERGAVPPGSGLGDEALREAVLRGRVGVVRLLAPHVSEEVKRDAYAFTPLHEAAFFGDEARVRGILDGAEGQEAVDVNAKGGGEDVTALHLACRGGHAGVVRLLLERGADKEEPSSDGSRPLHDAARLNNVDVMRELLDGGADIEAPASAEDTPLHVACRAGAVEAATLLLDREAAVDAGSGDDKTPLMYASRIADVASVRLLLGRGADVSAADLYGATVLHSVCGGGEEALAVAKLFLDRGAAIDARDWLGRTPLLRAVDRPCTSLASILVDRGADVNPADEAGRTPLRVAREEGLGALVRQLEAMGAAE
jgi:ankyrin repeat protein